MSTTADTPIIVPDWPLMGIDLCVTCVNAVNGWVVSTRLAPGKEEVTEVTPQLGLQIMRNDAHIMTVHDSRILPMVGMVTIHGTRYCAMHATMVHEGR